MDDVGILLVDDDVAAARALKQVLDSEGWRVRIVPGASIALAELATGIWNLAIVNVTLAGPQSPLFITLRELARVQAPAPEEAAATTPAKLFRALFLVPVAVAKDVGPLLEHESLPYSLKPYHLHDFLEKVSELLQETGAIKESLRSLGGFSGAKRRPKDARSSRGARNNVMFAPREAYHMTEEEIAEYEREEEEQKKKRKKNVLDIAPW